MSIGNGLTVNTDLYKGIIEENDGDLYGTAVTEPPLVHSSMHTVKHRFIQLSEVLTF